ncbi:hypothetical protein DFQ28_007676 [Apophysomyces sp. BC1034]|nr:hypothetical protein DFQ30_004480 [Apophysomyces sp. BC1015]KAG0180157.1 hypothetical protein DFQ29_001171 [Apophysomyces sp. BC1021]KAG0192773.1 hypothetical protein DFQ28_007676 [Apophysomyces sp. BC1034]
MQRFATSVANEPGKGILVCSCRGNEAKLSRIHAQYPLKFVPTRSYASRLAVVYMLSYGGGIVSGDTFDIQLEINPQAILLLLTQGNTKIFKDRAHQRQWMASIAQESQPSLPFSSLLPDSKTVPGQKISLQKITADISPTATLLLLPDPVTSFRDSSFQSRQTFRLADPSSQLVLLDWFTSGRLTRGENWSFKHYSSRIDVWMGQRLILKDHMVLEDEEYLRTSNSDDASYASRLRPYTCFATLVIIGSNGSLLEQCIRNIQEKAEAERLLPNSMQSADARKLLWSVSPIKKYGVLVRVAGMTTEKVRDFVKLDCLSHGLQQMVGEGMFSKVLM